jgi:hypothetical protein
MEEKSTYLSVPEMSSKVIASLTELQSDDFMHYSGLGLLGNVRDEFRSCSERRSNV